MSFPSFYRISISNPHNTANTATDGFIDNCRVENYLASTIGADGINQASLDNLPANFTYNNSLSKKRANYRYDFMVQQIEIVSNIYVSNVVAVGANATTEASPYVFNCLVEAGDSSLQTWDENNPGTVITDPVATLARCVSRALIQNVVVQAMVLDPTANTTIGVLGTTRSTPRFGERYISNLSVGPVYATLSTANAAVTVTPLYQPNTSIY